MSELDELVAWCKEARDLLKTGLIINKSAGVMDKAIDAVSEALGKLAGFAGQSESHGGFMKEFRAIALRAHNTAVREEIKELSEKLATLADKVKALLPEAEAQEAYFKARDELLLKIGEEKTQPNAELAALNELIKQAREQDKASGLKGFQGAKTAIEDLTKGTLAKLVQKRVTANVALKQQTAAAPGCVDLLNKLVADIERLKTTRQGVDAEIAKAEADLGRAKLLSQAEKWVEASDILNKINVAAIDELGKKARKNVDGNALIVRGEAALRAIERMTPLTAEHRTPLSQAVALLNGKPDKAATDKATALVVALETKLAALSKQYDQVTGQSTTLTGRVHALADAAPPAAPATVVATLRSMLSGLITLLEQKNIPAAYEAAQRLQERIDKVEQEWGAASRAWQQQKAELTGALRGKLESYVVASDAVPQKVNADAQSLLAASSDARIKQLEDDGNWTALGALHRTVSESLTGFASDAGKFIAPDMKKARTEADQKVQAARQPADAAVSKLLKQRKDAGITDPVAEALQKRLQDFDAAWTRTLATACAVEALDLENQKKLLAQLENEATDASSEAAQAKAADAQAQSAAEAKFNAMAESIRSALDTLRSVAAKEANRMLAQLEALAGAKDKAWTVKLAALTQLDLQGAADRAFAVNGSEGARGNLQSIGLQLCNDADAAVKELGERRASFKWRNMLDDTDAVKDTIASLKARIKTLRELVDTPNQDAARTSQDEVKAIIARVKAMSAELASGSNPFATLSKQMDDLAATLKKANSTLKANVPKQLSAIEAEFAKAKDSIYTLEAAAAQTEYLRLKGLVDGIQEASRGVDQLRRDLEWKLEGVAPLMSKMKSGGVAAAWCQAVEKRIEAARTLGEKQPDKLATAASQVTTIKQELVEALSDPAVALERQKTLLAEQQRTALLKESYEASLRVFNERSLVRAEKALEAPGADGTQLDEIKRMVKAAEKSAKAEDYAGAVRQIKLAEARVQEVISNPSGASIGSRNALPSHAEAYAATVRKLVASLEALPGKVSSYLDSQKVPSSASGKIVAAVTNAARDMQSHFNANAFEAAAASMSNDNESAEKRRAVRELGLRQVREMRQFIEGHPVIVSLFANPIAVEVRALGRELEQRLTALDANLRRAVH